VRCPSFLFPGTRGSLQWPWTLFPGATMTESHDRLRQNVSRVEERITAACRRAGRARTEVTLVAVTKYVTAAQVLPLRELGVTHWGESRPQELWKKAAEVADVTWHLVGHLQRNKAARTLPLVQLIHSVDSVRLLEELEKEAAKQQRILDILFEIHLSGEETKQGFDAIELPSLPDTLSRLNHIRVQGLMCMAPLEGTLDDARRVFARLRQLKEQLAPQLSPPHAMRHLSMGMTHDFEVAIEEGATLVRIGSALFEGMMGKESA
jgi:pyridoxal phosphate enzyme (YggS family)